MNKKILVVARSFPPKTGGIENFIHSIYSNLELPVTVIAPYEKGCHEFDAQQHIDIRRSLPLPAFLRKRKVPIVPMFFTALRLALTGDYGQIHCEQVQSGIIGYLLGKLFGIPYLVYAYGSEVTGGGAKGFKTTVFNNADIIVSISKMTSRALIVGFGIDEAKIRLVCPGVNPDLFKPNIDCATFKEKFGLTDKKIILTVGRLSEKVTYKGQDVVIRAMPLILREIPNSVYVIAGEGNDRQRLELLAQQTGVGANIVFSGYVETKELPLLYNSCDVFVMPSREKADESGNGRKVEGFGIVFLEAGACGKPVIGGRSGGIADAVLDGVTGLLASPEDVREVAEKCVLLLKDETLAKQMGEVARKRIETSLTHFHVAREIRALALELGERKS